MYGVTMKFRNTRCFVLVSHLVTFYLRPTSHHVSESNVQQKRYLFKCDPTIPDFQLAYSLRLCTPDNFTPICRSHFTCHILTFLVSVYKFTRTLNFTRQLMQFYYYLLLVFSP